MQESMDLSELIHLLLKKLWLIVLVSVIGFLFAFGITKLFITPQYKSFVRFYISNMKSEDSKQDLTVNDINTAQKLVNTFTVILQSDRVLDNVITTANLDCTPAQLKKMIKIDPINNSLVMKVEVITDDPQRSKNIAHTIAEVAPIQIEKITKMDYVSLLDDARLNTNPCSPKTLLNCAIGFLLGLILSVLLVVVREVFDTRVKGEEDIKRFYNIPVLGVIPNFHSQFKGGYERYER